MNKYILLHEKSQVILVNERNPYNRILSYPMSSNNSLSFVKKKLLSNGLLHIIKLMKKKTDF